MGRRLSEDRMRTLALLDALGVPRLEIARRLGCSPSTVDNQRACARRLFPVPHPISVRRAS